ncbi:MAG: hypothetical protein KGL97_15765 [Alphaproteobacteria bacterium]|nr:hypothetical protein [Alphaproteobacteria bacterium]
MRKWIIVLSAIFAAGLGSLAQAQTPPPKPDRCFFIGNFRNWKAPDARTIYIRVNFNRYYRLDLAGECPAMLWPDARLITVWRGSDVVCDALDWDLKVSNGPPREGAAEPCIVKTMIALSHDEAEAIPRAFKP